jgi:hypothetical protein
MLVFARSLPSGPRPARLAHDPTNGGQDFRREPGTFLGIPVLNQLAARAGAAAVMLKLFCAVSRMIVARGKTLFLNAFSDAPAIALYHRMGRASVGST